MNVTPLVATPIPVIVYTFKRQCFGHRNCKAASYGDETRKITLRYEHRLRVILMYGIRCVKYKNKGCFNTFKKTSLLRKINCQLLQLHVPTLISHLQANLMSMRFV